MENETKNTGADFTIFISGLMMEGLVALGVMEHPVTKEIKHNLQHATLVIDTVAMLQEKTKGNLTKDEADNLERILSQLRMGYVNLTDKHGKEGDKEEGKSKEYQPKADQPMDGKG